MSYFLQKLKLRINHLNLQGFIHLIYYMKIYFILILSSLTFVLNAQNNGFLKVLEDNTYLDLPVTSIINQKGNFVILGTKVTNEEFNRNLLSISEVNKKGEIVKFKTIDIDTLTFFDGIYNHTESLIEKNNAYYLCVPTFNLMKTKEEPYLMKLDENFNVVWMKHYPPRKDILTTYSLGGLREINENILLLGFSRDFIPLNPGFTSSENNIEIIKVDTSGNLLQQNFIKCDSCQTLVRTFAKVNENLFLIGGLTDKNFNERISSFINIDPAMDGFVYAIDSNGNLLNEYIKQSYGVDQAINVFDQYGTYTQHVETNFADSTYVMVYSALLMGQINPYTLEKIWEDTIAISWNTNSIMYSSIDSQYTENNFVDGFWSVARQTNDGGFILARRSVNIINNDTTQGAMFVRFDSNRNILWKRKYYYDEDVVFTFQGNIIEDSEGYFWHQGFTIYKKPAEQPQNQWVLRMDAYGCINENDCGIPEPLPTFIAENSVFLHPNPAKDVVKLFVANEPQANEIEIAIVNPTGQLMYKQIHIANKEFINVEINVSNFASGWYALYINYGKKDLKVIKFIKN